MSIHDLYNETIKYDIEICKNFLILRKKIKEITKLFIKKEIVNIECNLKIIFRSEI